MERKEGERRKLVKRERRERETEGESERREGGGRVGERERGKRKEVCIHHSCVNVYILTTVPTRTWSDNFPFPHSHFLLLPFSVPNTVCVYV